MAYDTVVFRRLLPSPPAPPVGMLALRVLDAHSEPIGSRTSPLKREVSQRPECQPRYPDVLQFRHGSRGAKWRRCELLQSLRERASSYMTTKEISGGVVHDLPEDLRDTLASDAEALAAWEDLTPLARNEWICWTISVKKPETRQQHVDRVRTELKEGMRRPCCWLGCIHRTDKAISPSVQYVLSKRSKKSS